MEKATVSTSSCSPGAFQISSAQYSVFVADCLLERTVAMQGHSPSATSNINTEHYDIMCSESAFNRLPIVRPHTQFAISLPHAAAGLDVLQTLIFGLERAAKHEKGLLSETDRPCSDSV